MIADSVLNVCFHGIGTPRHQLDPVKVSTGLILVNFWEF